MFLWQKPPDGLFFSPTPGMANNIVLRGEMKASISHNTIHITPDWVLTRSLLSVDLSVAVGDHYLVNYTLSTYLLSVSETNLNLVPVDTDWLHASDI